LNGRHCAPLVGALGAVTFASTTAWNFAYRNATELIGELIGARRRDACEDQTIFDKENSRHLDVPARAAFDDGAIARRRGAAARLTRPWARTLSGVAQV